MQPDVKVLKKGVAAITVAALSCLAQASVNAQSGPPAAPAQSASTSGPTLRELVQQKQDQLSAAAFEAVNPANSLTARLGLQPRQIERLNRLYDDFAAQRIEEEAKIAGWQDELKRAQSPVKPNERMAARLVRDIGNAQQKIATDFLKARTEALKTLTQQQRAQLQSLEADPQAVRGDKYHQLLLLRVEDILQVPLDTETGRRLLAELAYGKHWPNHYDRYGRSRYGDYGYDRFGVYAGYGHGHSIFGFGIGGIFGGIFGSYHHHHR